MRFHLLSRTLKGCAYHRGASAKPPHGSIRNCPLACSQPVSMLLTYIRRDIAARHDEEPRQVLDAAEHDKAIE